MKAWLCLSASMLLSVGSQAQETADRTLIARAAADRAPAAQVQPAAEDENLVEARARNDVAIAEARLELVLARKASKADRHEEAARRAIRALNALRALPARVDASALELQAEGLLARAEKKGVNVETLRVRQGAGGDGAASQATPPVDPDPLDLRADAARDIVRGYSGADTRDIDTGATADDLKQRATRNQAPSDLGFNPGREAFDRGAIEVRNEQRVMYQAALDDAAKSDELRRLVEAHEARVAPLGEVAYPDNWKERVGRRGRFAGGEVARSSALKDSTGREFYAAIYDINDLTYVAPDFQPSSSLDLVEDLRNTLDRDALRNRSQIFSGTAEDLAAGIPLLRFFGGVDDFAYRGPKYSREKALEIAEQVKAFTSQIPETRTIVSP